MQDLQIELENEGKDIQVVIINKTGADFDISKLISRCECPIFQDVSNVDAWNQHAGGKDDIIIYKSDGTLSSFLEFGGDLNINLGNDAGYQNVKTKILEAF